MMMDRGAKQRVGGGRNKSTQKAIVRFGIFKQATA